MSEGGQSFRDPAVTGNQQLRLWQDGLEIDLHLAAAGHSPAEKFVGQVQGDHRWRSLRDAANGLASDGALGAPPPPIHPSGSFPRASVMALARCLAEADPSKKPCRFRKRRLPMRSEASRNARCAAATWCPRPSAKRSRIGNRAIPNAKN